MRNAPDLIYQINADARRAGSSTSIAQFASLMSHAQYRVPYEITSRHVTAGQEVLDWGCGNGHFSILLRHLGARTTGYSFEDAPAFLADDPLFRHARGSEDDPRRIPFAAGTFDRVCSVGVLEHVWETGGDERDSLREIARILKPGGLFLTFHLPNQRGWIEPAFRALGVRTYHHKRRYDAAQIQRLWNDAGFDVVELGTYNMLPRNMATALPRSLRHSRLLAGVYDAMDTLLHGILARFATNYFVVGRRRE